MKKLLFTLIMTASVVSYAQKPILSKETKIADSTSESRWSYTVGLAAGMTLFANGNDMSPYYSKIGTTVQVPISANYRINPHWKLSFGVRYDFNWAPLAHCVEVVRDEEMLSQGIDFDTTAHVGTRRGNVMHNYIGIPIQVTWYPWARDRTLLGVSVDFYAGYAISRGISTANSRISLSGESNDKSWIGNDDPSMIPWKIEIGFTLSTDVIGLLHGIRLHANLLPTYKDLKTGEKIYTCGVTFFL